MLSLTRGQSEFKPVTCHLKCNELTHLPLIDLSVIGIVVWISLGRRVKIGLKRIGCNEQVLIDKVCFGKVS